MVIKPKRGSNSGGEIVCASHFEYIQSLNSRILPQQFFQQQHEDHSTPPLVRPGPRRMYPARQRTQRCDVEEGRRHRCRRH